MRTQKGIVLLATLWVLAILTMAAGFFSIWVANMLETARSNQYIQQLAIDAYSTQSNLLYLFATQPLSTAGLTTIPPNLKEAVRAPNPFETPAEVTISGEEIRLDGRAYKGAGNTFFSIQDEGGLIGVRDLGATRNHLANLVVTMGVEQENIAPMLDKLSDYIDSDDLTRLNGAEKDAYKENSKAGPRNWSLTTSQELKQVMSWDVARLENLSQLTSTSHSRNINFNFAPLDVLQAYPGFDTETAKKIISERDKRPFNSVTDLVARSGRQIIADDFGSSFLPWKYQKISIWSQDSRQLYEIHIQLTPTSRQGKPWILEYKLTLPRQNEPVIPDAQSTSTDIFATQVATDAG